MPSSYCIILGVNAHIPPYITHQLPHIPLSLCPLLSLGGRHKTG